MPETMSKSIYKCRRYPSSKYYEIDENLRFRIWRSTVASYDIAEKNRNTGAQLQSINVHNSPNCFWKIYLLCDFWCAQTCSFRAIFRLDALALSVIATATWLAGWLAVTLRYCIKTAKSIGKLFRPSESPIILVLWDPCADTKFQGEPHQRGR